MFFFLKWFFFLPPLLDFGFFLIQNRETKHSGLKEKYKDKIRLLCYYIYIYIHDWLADAYGSFVSTGVCNLEVPSSNPGRAAYLSSWLCIYSAPNCWNSCIIRLTTTTAFQGAGQANIICWTNAGLMFGQRRRRWTNIKPTLGQFIMFSGLHTQILPSV